MSTDPVDTLAPPAMAAWLRETAANTRRYSNPAWCDAHCKQHDPIAAHVAFRLEQAAELIEQLARGEHICARCYLRMMPPSKDSGLPEPDPLF